LSTKNFQPSERGPAARDVDLQPPDGQIKLMLSSKGKYAVRAATTLAEQFARDCWTPTAEIAEREHIPRKFLEAILVQLRDGGVVESHRGAQGGHRLSRDPATISVADIIRIIDGPLALTPCASVTRFRPCTDCADISSCRMQHLMRKARDAVADVLENCSLTSLAEDSEPGAAGTRKVRTVV
jgi:Rrf2 family protein